jgi:hypothetical protein
VHTFPRQVTENVNSENVFEEVQIHFKLRNKRQKVRNEPIELRLALPKILILAKQLFV